MKILRRKPARASLWTLLLIAISAFLAPAYAATPAAATKDALLQAETRRLDAQVSRDLVALGQTIADDGIYIHANGATQTKSEYLADVAAGKSRYRSIEVADRTVMLYGDKALSHGTITLNVGVDRKIVARYTGFYTWRDKRWQVLSWQSTPIGAAIPAPPAPAPAAQ